jgi:hypothetical protein
MFAKALLTVVSLMTNFLITGWILNWAPMDVMLTNEGYYADLCTRQTLSLSSSSKDAHTFCDEQQVGISSLWSAVLLSEFTILPNGVLMDFVGPAFFSLFLCIIHVGSLVATIYMSRSSCLLPITFFCMGTATQGCALLAMRTVYIFKTPRARKHWIVACCTILDCSAICTMIFYNLWDFQLIDINGMFWTLAILGGVLFAALFVFWFAFNRLSSTSENAVIVTEENPLLEFAVNLIGDEEAIGNLTLVDLFRSHKFYFFILLCAVNIYRIRYFLGIADYTLIYLHDKGTYLQLLGYCFLLSLVFAPLVDKILSQIENRTSSLHLVNVTVTALFLPWLIPNLPLQILTFALFIFARLFTFAVLNEYCSEEFTEKRFGLVMGSGFVAAAIPGAFTYEIVQVVLTEYNGNFWFFHLMCIGMAIPMAVIICLLHPKKISKAQDIDSSNILRSNYQLSISFTTRRNFIAS